MKSTKRFSVELFLAVLVVLLLVAASVLFYSRLHAKKIGSSTGEISGTLVGTAIGYSEGATQGISRGLQAGKEAGLSAEDTVAEIKGSFEEVGKLEVMSANVKLVDTFEHGDNYSCLFTVDGEVVFTVDLEQSDTTVSINGKKIKVIIPEPQLKFVRDSDSYVVLAEESKNSMPWSDAAKDGRESYIKSLGKIQEEAITKITNYEMIRNEKILI